MKYLVTGGAGFIGSNLVKELVNRNNEVTIIDNFSTGSSENIKDFYNDISLVPGCPHKLQDELEDENFDTIFHLGMPSSSPMYEEKPSLMSKVIEQYLDILKYTMDNGNNIVFASTSSMYGPKEPPHHENMEIEPFSMYTETRYYLERMSKMYHDLYGLDIVGIRPFSVYGPHEGPKEGFANMITQIIWWMLDSEEPVIYGDGSQTRDFTYVDDMIEAFILASKSDVGFGIYNAGTGVEISFNDIINKTNSFLGTDINAKYVDNPIDNYVQRTCADTTKAEEELGFNYTVKIDEGIKRQIDYYKNG